MRYVPLSQGVYDYLGLTLLMLDACGMQNIFLSQGPGSRNPRILQPHCQAQLNLPGPIGLGSHKIISIFE